MSAQSLKEYNGNGYNHKCLFENDQMERLIQAIDNNTASTKQQNDNFKYITKYLLIVVCIIAVGQKALDAAKDIWGKGEVSITGSK